MKLTHLKTTMINGILLWLFTILALQAKGQSESGVRLAKAAEALTSQQVTYDPAYVKIKYPGGDVPANTGVCTDVVIRAFRGVGIDLQKEVHEDMKVHFDLYPKKWNLTKTDTNIDHRRVPNLMTYFKRHHEFKKVSTAIKDYAPGDIVCWDLGGGTTHIGIVSSRKTAEGTWLIIHNIGAGQIAEDMLFSYKIIGHYAIRSL